MAGNSLTARWWPWLVLALVALAGAAAALGLTQSPYAQDFLARNQGPSMAHWLGTDQFGRDLMARLMTGAGMTLWVAGCATLIALLGGAGVGLLACIAGGWLRTFVFMVFDLLRTMPSLLVALALMTTVGAGTTSIIFAIGLTFAPLFAYVASAAYDRESVAGYVTAARLLGASSQWVAWRHVLPNVAGALVTQIAIVMPRAITTESVLSFLGMGVAPDTPTWGRIIAAASEFAEQSPSSLALPVILLAITTLSISLIGHGVRDVRRGAQKGGALI